ncbi:bcl-2-like protein 10 [Phasianus colchicus]|uniref:Bcl-2 Bcl-2 homology region 1-3 domain-containing protein n=1 Tax=Phasianus colchicus TaxID=9054 RepID=A0A669PBN3_PHACC|nr:bcl-2-like protein 10 [Phasianus colchicus]
MPGSLKEETALLLEDYFQHRAGGAALPPSATAAELRRAAAELERRERPFFRSCAPLARAEPREAAALLRRVAAQLEADGGLNWGRLLALVVFAGTLAAALAKSGCEEGPGRLAAALAAYLAEEQGEWLREHGGWDGFCRFFGRHGSQPADQNSTLSNAIMAAAGFGIAGLAFLLVVR